MLCKIFTVRALDLGKSLVGCIFGNLVPLFFMNFQLTLFFSDEKKVGPWLWRWRARVRMTLTLLLPDKTGSHEHPPFLNSCSYHTTNPPVFFLPFNLCTLWTTRWTEAGARHCFSRRLANCRLQLVVLGSRGLARLKQLTPFPIAATSFKRRLRTTFLNHVWDMLQICWECHIWHPWTPSFLKI